MVVDWPSLNSKVWLRLSCCGAEHPTRVEGFTETGCIVAAPSSPHVEMIHPSNISTEFFLGWVNVHHALEVPVKLTATDDSRVPTWTMEALGDVEETQRRSFVRLEIAMEIQLHLMMSGAPTSARVVDISEGGVKCMVDVMSPDPAERVFDCTISLPDATFVLPSQMVWRGKQEGAFRTLGIRFVEPERKAADAIRQFIFRTQIEQRRKQNA